MSDSVLNPKVSLNIIPGSQITTVAERRVLLCGTRSLTLIGAPAVSLTENVNSFSEEQIDDSFGAGSNVASMIRRAQKTLARVTPQPQIDVLSVNSPSGGSTSAASAQIVVVGTSTGAGTYRITVGSENDYAVDIPIPANSTKAQADTAIKSALSSLLIGSVFKVASGSNVMIEAIERGSWGNSLGISIEGDVPGFQVGITGFTGGVGVPALTGIFDPVDDIRQSTIVWPADWSSETLRAELDTRFNTPDTVLDGVGVSVQVGTTTELKALVSTLNSPSIVTFGNKSVLPTTKRKAPAVFEISDIIATEVAVIRALRLTKDSPVTRFGNTAGSPQDAVGGIHFSSKPYHNTLLPNIAIPKQGTYFSQAEQNDLLDSGISVLGANRVSNAVILGTVVTAYQRDSAGNRDRSLKYLNTVDQISIVREFYVNNLRARYSQSRLTTGSISTGYAVENESSIRSFCIQLYQELAAELITQDGNVALQDYKDSLAVNVDVGKGRVTINQSPLLVGQLRVIIGAIEVNFG